MLYERWCEIAERQRSELALVDTGLGRRWRFAELLEAGHASAGPVTSALSFAQGTGSEFVIETIRAWRTHQVFCPLETGQSPPAVPGPPPGIVHLKTTSASTGAPRLVALTAGQLAADADQIVATMGLRPDWPNLGVISLAHSYGFSSLVLPLLLHGIPLILLPAPLPELLRTAGQFSSGATLPAVPALWRIWHDAGAIPTQVRLAISAGAPLPVALEREVFLERQLKIHNFYGASECGGIAYDPTQTPRTDEAGVGRPMVGVEVRLGEGGCLEVRSPAVGETYWPAGDPALSGRAFRTSDLAELRDGWVFLRGRAGDQINVAGRKVAPETVEAALRGAPGVRDCLVFGVPDATPDRGERIVAAVVTSGGADVDALRRALLERLAGWQVPREWWFVESLAVNQRGKRSRAEWRARFLESHAPRAPV